MATNEKSSAVLTVAEIKKALECCIRNDGCEQCPISEKCFFFYNKPHVETPEILRLSLDLINRQQAEIESVNERADMWHREAELNAAELIKMQADNERLKKLLEEADINYNKCAKRFYTEAIKEFAEQVKTAFYYEFEELIPSIMAEKIDNLVKEMVG